MKIFCLIPAFNEKGNLEQLTEDLSRILPQYTEDYKIFYVLQGNDGSIDEMQKLKIKYKKLDWVYYPRALGIGRAYKIGFDEINSHFTHVLTLDADLNHEPSALPDFIAEMKKNKSDLVIGSRFMTGGKFDDKRLWKRAISKLINKLIILLLKFRIHDISSGYRLIKRELIDEIKREFNEDGYPSYMELIIRAAKAGYKLSEVPIAYKARIWGKSKMGRLKTIYDYLKFLPRVIFAF